MWEIKCRHLHGLERVAGVKLGLFILILMLAIPLGDSIQSQEASALSLICFGRAEVPSYVQFVLYRTFISDPAQVICLCTEAGQ